MHHSKILITAAGSIGERHIRNLWQMGYRNLVVYRTRNLPFRDLGDAKVEVVLDWQEALDSGAKAAFITSPTHLHMPQTLDSVRAGMHVFVEKPIAHQTKQLSELLALAEEHKKVIQVGYMLEFHPFLKEMKSYCDNQYFGKLISLESYWGDYLPNWHPWEDYKTSYAALTEMGGGVALTLSHELDTLMWLKNDLPNSYFMLKSNHEALHMQADNISEVIMRFEDGCMARAHMNYIEKKPKRRTILLFANGRLTFEYFKNSLVIEDFLKDSIEPKILSDFDRNDLFVSEARHFFKRIEDNDFAVDDGLIRACEIVKICNQE